MKDENKATISDLLGWANDMLDRAATLCGDEDDPIKERILDLSTAIWELDDKTFLSPRAPHPLTAPDGTLPICQHCLAVVGGEFLTPEMNGIAMEFVLHDDVKVAGRVWTSGDFVPPNVAEIKRSVFAPWHLVVKNKAQNNSPAPLCRLPRGAFDFALVNVNEPEEGKV
jgi:hypothetical protein